MAVQVHLAEGVIAFRIGTAFFHPGRFPVTCHNRNGVITGGGADGVGQAAEEVFFLEGCHQSVFVFIRDQVPAFGIRTDSQGILHFLDITFPPKGLPEGFGVGITGPAGFGVRLGTAGTGIDLDCGIDGAVSMV